METNDCRILRRNYLGFRILKKLKKLFVNYNPKRDVVGWKISKTNRKTKEITIKFKILNRGRNKGNGKRESDKIE